MAEELALPEGVEAGRVDAASPGTLSAAQLLLGAAQPAPPQAGGAPAGLAPPAARTGGLQLARSGLLKRAPARALQLSGEQAPAPAAIAATFTHARDTPRAAADLLDPPPLGTVEVKQLWNAMSERMRVLLPRASLAMAKALSEAQVRERLYSTGAGDVLSGDLLVNNVGVSAGYQSPPHFDTGDVGWTFAFAVKCACACTVHSRKRNAPG